MATKGSKRKSLNDLVKAMAKANSRTARAVAIRNFTNQVNNMNVNGRNRVNPPLYQRYSAPFRQDRISSPLNRVWRNNIGIRFTMDGSGAGIIGLATPGQDRKSMGMSNG